MGSDPSGMRCGPAVDEQYKKQLLSNPADYQYQPINQCYKKVNIASTTKNPSLH